MWKEYFNDNVSLGNNAGNLKAKKMAIVLPLSNLQTHNLNQYFFLFYIKILEYGYPDDILVKRIA